MQKPSPWCRKTGFANDTTDFLETHHTHSLTYYLWLWYYSLFIYLKRSRQTSWPRKQRRGGRGGSPIILVAAEVAARQQYLGLATEFSDLQLPADIGGYPSGQKYKRRQLLKVHKRMLNHACCEVTNVHVSSINSKTTLIRFLNPELTGNMTQLYSCKTPGWLGRCSLSDPKSHSPQDKQSQAPWSTAGSGPRWGKSHSRCHWGCQQGTQEMAGPWNECPLTISIAKCRQWLDFTYKVEKE